MMIWRLLASVLAGVVASGERTSSGCLGLSESGISGSRRLILNLATLSCGYPGGDIRRDSWASPFRTSEPSSLEKRPSDNRSTAAGASSYRAMSPGSASLEMLLVF